VEGSEFWAAEGNLKEKLRTQDGRTGFYTKEAKGGWEIHPADAANRRGSIGSSI